MKDKTKFALMAIVLTLVALSFVGMGAASLIKGIIPRAIVGFTTAVALGILFAVILRKAYADMKTGMPSEDERSKRVRMYAAGNAYFISLFLWVGIMFVRHYLTREQIIGTGVAGMAVIFVISWWYLSRKEDTT